MTRDNKKEVLFRPIVGRTFRFRCHRDLPCFTVCCADLNLVLTPYDILRLKNRLDLSSDEFLDRHTQIRLDHSRFPMVHLKMNQTEDRKCPFVTPEGCSVYEDRPGACRVYPVGRAAKKVGKENETIENFFLVDETHCLGFQEEQEWTVEDWMAHEGVDEHNAMNDPWLEIITSRKVLGPKKDVSGKLQMFYMASYNLDKFRQFIFQTKFLRLFRVEKVERRGLATDDVKLMEFAFDWLKFSLFGDRTMQMRRGSVTGRSR